LWDQIKINIKSNIKRKLFNVLNLHLPWNQVWDQIKLNIKLNIKIKLFNFVNVKLI
jgi:hypothetical protein